MNRLNDEIDNITDELIEINEDTNRKITRRLIGTLLSDWDLNNAKNIKKVIELLKLRGFDVL